VRLRYTVLLINDDDDLYKSSTADRKITQTSSTVFNDFLVVELVKLIPKSVENRWASPKHFLAICSTACDLQKNKNKLAVVIRFVTVSQIVLKTV
jgi:hypothetical protein